MFAQLYKDLHRSLKGILHEVTITEFMYEYVWPDLSRLIEVSVEKRARINAKRTLSGLEDGKGSQGDEHFRRASTEFRGGENAYATRHR